MHFCNKKEGKRSIATIMVDTLGFSTYLLFLTELQHHKDKRSYPFCQNDFEHFQTQKSKSFVNEELILNRSISKTVFQKIY